jgi:hypothetical protein
MHTRGRNAEEGNPLPFHKGFLHAAFTAHPKGVNVRDLGCESAVNGEGGIHSAARPPGANQ